MTSRSARPGTSTPSQKLIVATSTACPAARKRREEQVLRRLPLHDERLPEARLERAAERLHRARRGAQDERAAAGDLDELDDPRDGGRARTRGRPARAGRAGGRARRARGSRTATGRRARASRGARRGGRGRSGSSGRRRSSPSRASRWCRRRRRRDRRAPRAASPRARPGSRRWRRCARGRRASAT